MLHAHPDAEEPRTRSPEAPSGAPPALAAPRLTARPRRPSGGPPRPLGRRDHRCHRAAGAPLVPDAAGADTKQEYQPGRQGHPRGRLELGAEQAHGSGGAMNSIPSSPRHRLPHSPAPPEHPVRRPGGASLYAAPGPGPDGEHLGTGSRKSKGSTGRHTGRIVGDSLPPPRRRTGSRTGTRSAWRYLERGESLLLGAHQQHRGARRPPRRSPTGHHGGARGAPPGPRGGRTGRCPVAGGGWVPVPASPPHLLRYADAAGPGGAPPRDQSAVPASDVPGEGTVPGEALTPSAGPRTPPAYRSRTPTHREGRDVRRRGPRAPPAGTRPSGAAAPRGRSPGARGVGVPVRQRPAPRRTRSGTPTSSCRSASPGASRYAQVPPVRRPRMAFAIFPLVGRSSGPVRRRRRAGGRGLLAGVARLEQLEPGFAIGVLFAKEMRLAFGGSQGAREHGARTPRGPVWMYRPPDDARTSRRGRRLYRHARAGTPSPGATPVLVPRGQLLPGGAPPGPAASAYRYEHLRSSPPVPGSRPRRLPGGPGGGRRDEPLSL